MRPLLHGWHRGGINVSLHRDQPMRSRSRALHPTLLVCSNAVIDNHLLADHQEPAAAEHVLEGEGRVEAEEESPDDQYYFVRSRTTDGDLYLAARSGDCARTR